MNIFIIVSSYPSKSNPSAGIFIKNQIKLIAKYYPDLNFFISLYGEEQYKLPLSKPLIALRKFINYLKNKSKKTQIISNNFIEIYNPTTNNYEYKCITPCDIKLPYGCELVLF